jgi:hypothetical protein
MARKKKSAKGSNGAGLNGHAVHDEATDIFDELLDEHAKADAAARTEPATSTEAESVSPPPAAPAPKRTRYLESKLSAKERGELSGKMMRALCEMKELDAKIDSSQNVTKGLKKERDIIETRALDYAQQRARGSSWGEVEVYELEGTDERDPGQDVLGVVTRRSDTHEIVDWRPFKFNERQGDLFDAKPVASAP